MGEGLKNRTYLEGMRLKKSGLDDEVIRARLEKQGIPEDMIKSVIQNLNMKRKAEKKEEHQPMYYSGLIKVGLGVLLAINFSDSHSGENIPADRFYRKRYSLCADSSAENEIIGYPSLSYSTPAFSAEVLMPLIIAELKPLCSISFNPAMVQPLGEVTLSISCSG